MNPRRLNAHDHALPTELLEEKAARLHAEQGLPSEPEPHHCPPRPCYWHEEPEGGGRYLIPGCMARVNDPDAEACTCPSTARQLEAARAELATLKRARAGLQRWHDQIVKAVYAHPDGIQLMQTAATSTADRTNHNAATEENTRP